MKMDITVFQIDLVEVDFDPKEIYAESAPFLSGYYLAKIEEDGDILPLHQIRVIPPSGAEAAFEIYKTCGVHIETVVASLQPPVLSKWSVLEKLPCHLTRLNVRILKSIMTSNHWDHYICMAQTQILVGTTSNEFYKTLKQGKYASLIRTEEEAGS